MAEGAGRPGRIVELDAVRGLAVCGILVVNLWQKTVGETGGARDLPVDRFVEVAFEGRFYPIFSFLFGLGFVLFLESARGTTPHPRVVLAQRLVVLAGFGALHRLISPGEVLLPYAEYGLLFLLPASFLPWWVSLVGGSAGLLWAMSSGNGYYLIPPLFLLGMAYARGGRKYGGQIPSGVLAVMCVLAAAESYRLGTGMAAGVVGAFAYGTAVLLALRTRARDALLWVLEPLGKTALTNYVTGSLIGLAALTFMADDPGRWTVLWVAAAGIAVQLAFARVWLAGFRQGPLEAVWRKLTWLGHPREKPPEPGPLPRNPGYGPPATP